MNWYIEKGIVHKAIMALTGSYDIISDSYSVNSPFFWPKIPKKKALGSINHCYQQNDYIADC